MQKSNKLVKKTSKEKVPSGKSGKKGATKERKNSGSDKTKKNVVNKNRSDEPGKSAKKIQSSESNKLNKKKIVTARTRQSKNAAKSRSDEGITPSKKKSKELAAKKIAASNAPTSSNIRKKKSAVRKKTTENTSESTSKRKPNQQKSSESLRKKPSAQPSTESVRKKPSRKSTDSIRKKPSTINIELEGANMKPSNERMQTCIDNDVVRSPCRVSKIKASSPAKEVPHKQKSNSSTPRDNSFRNLSKRLRRATSEVGKKIMTFVSRPIRENTMDRFMKKVEERKKAQSQRSSSQEASQEQFPGSKTTKKTKGAACDIFYDGATKEAQDDETQLDPVDLQTPSAIMAASPSPIALLPSGCEMVRSNHNNRGRLFIRGEPFWLFRRKKDKPEEPTDDDIPMNADIVLDVHEGRIKLVAMPNNPIVLDIYGETEELEKRDKLFFNKDVLFGNTIRSMINIIDSEALSERKAPTAEWKQRKLTVNLPTTFNSYTRKSANTFTNEALATKTTYPMRRQNTIEASDEEQRNRSRRAKPPTAAAPPPAVAELPEDVTIVSSIQEPSGGTPGKGAAPG